MRMHVEVEASSHPLVQRHAGGEEDLQRGPSPAGAIPSPAAAVLNIQRTAGNQATLALLNLQRNCRPGHVGPPVDHKGWTGKSQEGRDVAMDTVCSAPPGSNGQAMCSAIGTFFQIFGNLAGGRIGAHYKEPEMLKRIDAPCTEQGLREIAQHETENFWKEQPGVPGLAGRAVSEKTRADRLIKMAKKEGILKDPGGDT